MCELPYIVYSIKQHTVLGYVITIITSFNMNEYTKYLHITLIKLKGYFMLSCENKHTFVNM